jgi:hypothetical protein
MMTSMAHSITHEQYKTIRDDRSYSVVSFRCGRRLGTYSGLTIIAAVTELLNVQSRGYDVLLIRNLPGGEVSWDKRDYMKYVTTCGDLYGGYRCALPYGHEGTHATEGNFTIWPRSSS